LVVDVAVVAAAEAAATTFYVDGMVVGMRTQ